MKDYLAKYKNYRRLDRDLGVGALVRYRVLPKTMKSRNQKGYLSQYVAIITQKIGNSYEIQLKTNEDIMDDENNHENTHFNGPKIIVPARDLIPYKERRGNSKYNMDDLFEEGPYAGVDDNEDDDIDNDSDSEVEPYDIPEDNDNDNDNVPAAPGQPKRTRSGNSRYFNRDFESYQIGRK